MAASSSRSSHALHGPLHPRRQLLAVLLKAQKHCAHQLPLVGRPCIPLGCKGSHQFWWHPTALQQGHKLPQLPLVLAPCRSCVGLHRFRLLLLLCLLLLLLLRLRLRLLLRVGSTHCHLTSNCWHCCWRRFLPNSWACHTAGLIACALSCRRRNRLLLLLLGLRLCLLLLSLQLLLRLLLPLLLALFPRLSLLLLLLLVALQRLLLLLLLRQALALGRASCTFMRSWGLLLLRWRRRLGLLLPLLPLLPLLLLLLMAGSHRGSSLWLWLLWLQSPPSWCLRLLLLRLRLYLTCRLLLLLLLLLLLCALLPHPLLRHPQRLSCRLRLRLQHPPHSLHLCLCKLPAPKHKGAALLGAWQDVMACHMPQLQRPRVKGQQRPVWLATDYHQLWAGGGAAQCRLVQLCGQSGEVVMIGLQSLDMGNLGEQQSWCYSVSLGHGL